MLSMSHTTSATIRFGRLYTLLVALAAMTAWPTVSQAQFGRSRGGDSGGDRAERMRAMFSQMRQSRGGGDRGGSSDDRRERMQQFFSQMRGSQGGNRGSSRGGSRGGGREGSRGGGREGSRGGSGRGRGGSSGKRAEPKPKPRMTLDLPAEYADRDLDKDGQLGLYEWKLSEIADFRSFDVNADGFLTPRELLTGGPAETAESTASSDDGGSSKDSDTKDSDRKDSGSSTTKTASTKSAASGDKSASTRDARTVRYAKMTFKGIDKDKDGKLTLEEWGQSSRTRARFTKAKVKLKLPIDEAGFIAVYPASR